MRACRRTRSRRRAIRGRPAVDELGHQAAGEADDVRSVLHSLGRPNRHPCGNLLPQISRPRRVPRRHRRVSRHGGARSDERHRPPLGVGVALDVALRGLERGGPGELLDIPKRPTGRRNFPGGPGDERPAARVAGTSVEPQRAVEPLEPVGYRIGAEVLAALAGEHVRGLVEGMADGGPAGRRALLPGAPRCSCIACWRGCLRHVSKSGSKEEAG